MSRKPLNAANRKQGVREVHDIRLASTFANAFLPRTSFPTKAGCMLSGLPITSQVVMPPRALIGRDNAYSVIALLAALEEDFEPAPQFLVKWDYPKERPGK